MTSDEPENDEPTEPNEEQQPENGGVEPEETADNAAVKVSQEYVIGNTTAVAGDYSQTTNTFVINSQVDISRLLRELERDRKPKRPPLPADAPKIDQVRRWFEELPDDRRRCYALTLAIFNGVKFSDYLNRLILLHFYWNVRLDEHADDDADD